MKREITIEEVLRRANRVLSFETTKLKLNSVAGVRERTIPTGPEIKWGKI
jgi:hypothetical protein